jgi:hypothetical protein
MSISITKLLHPDKDPLLTPETKAVRFGSGNRRKASFPLTILATPEINQSVSTTGSNKGSGREEAKTRGSACDNNGGQVW